MADGDVDVAITTTRAFNCNVFDGVDDNVKVNYKIPLNTQPFSASIDVYCREVGNTDTLIEFGYSHGEGLGYLLRIINTRVIRFYYGGTAVHSTGTIPYNVWTNITIIVSSSKVQFYINGVFDSEQNITLKGDSTEEFIYIGSEDVSSPFKGGIKNVRIWNKELLSTDPLKLYNGGEIREGLIGEWKLGGNYEDTSGFGRHGTNSGSLPFIVEDNIAQAVTAQRVLTSADGTFLMCRGAGGQVVTAGIVE